MLIFVGILGALCLAQTAHGVSFGEECSSVNDCDSDKELTVCAKSNSICTKMFCGCGTGKAWDAGTTKCQINDNLAKIGDECFDSTIVPNAECTGSPKKVACKSGYTAKDNVLCTNANSKVIGEACTAATDTCYAYTANELPVSTRSCSHAEGVCDCSSSEIISGTNCKSRTLNDRCSASSQCPGTLQCVSGRCGCLSPTYTRSSIGCYKTFGAKKSGETCTDSTDCVKDTACVTCPSETGKKCASVTDVTAATDDCQKDGGAFRPGQTSLTVYLGAVGISLVLKFW